MHPRSHVISSGAVNILPCDIRDLNPRSVTVLLAVNAGRDVNRLIDIGELDIPKRYIFDVAVPWICLDPCCIAAVREVDSVENNIVDVIWLGRILTNAADAHSP